MRKFLVGDIVVCRVMDNGAIIPIEILNPARSQESIKREQDERELRQRMYDSGIRKYMEEGILMSIRSDGTTFIAYEDRPG
jgi:hypothetical protein